MYCNPDKLTIGTFLLNLNSYNLEPVYQRESAIWSPEKQQLFIDSILNRFDVPKFYFHDLREKDPRYDFAVIDGKQRLFTINQFYNGELALSNQFELLNDKIKDPIQPGLKFSELSLKWQEAFKSYVLDVVHIRDADEYDIEELFSRLNNGESLTAAEKRNAMGGNMAALIREVAKSKFFKEKVSFPNKRKQHLEVAAKILLIEQAEMEGKDFFVDLKKKYLDKMVDDGRHLSAAEKMGLENRVDEELKQMNRIFTKNDMLLRKQAYAPLYYLFIKSIVKEYAKPTLYSDIGKFLRDFTVMREENLSKPEDIRDPVLLEFGRQIQQGTNDRLSLKSRVSILTRYFLRANPDIAIKDKKRAFTPDERYVIWITGGQKCQECQKKLPDIDMMSADHINQHAFGGQTELQNARCLCEDCNRVIAKKVK